MFRKNDRCFGDALSSGTPSTVEETKTWADILVARGVFERLIAAGYAGHCWNDQVWRDVVD